MYNGKYPINSSDRKCNLIILQIQFTEKSQGHLIKSQKSWIMQQSALGTYPADVDRSATSDVKSFVNK